MDEAIADNIRLAARADELVAFRFAGFDREVFIMHLRQQLDP